MSQESSNPSATTTGNARNQVGQMISSRQRPATHYDVIVIGGGLGGMTAANQMAKQGRKVLLLEAHNKLGGLATWFRRQGGQHIFDISLHGFPYGMVKTCRKYWNKEIADKIEQLKEVRFINPQFDLTTNFTRADYERHLRDTFHVAPEQAKAFFDAVEAMNFYDGDMMTNRQFFDRYFPGRDDVVRFLLEPMSYANGSTLEDPAISFAIVFGNFISRGVYIFKGGTELMIEMMKQELLHNGVDIRLQAKIERCQVEEAEPGKPARISGVWFEGELINAPVVISNSSLYHTIFTLTGAQYFPDNFVTQAQKVRANSSSCQVYLGLKEGSAIDFCGDLIFTSKAAHFNTQDLLSPEISSQTFSLYYPDTRAHLPPRYAIVSSSNARYEDWQGLDQATYEARKQHLIKRALEDLEEIIPGITSKIEYVEAATPRTVERYTHHYRASSFGTKWEGLAVSKEIPQHINGLFHAGSVGIIMSGWLGAANYGVIQSHEAETYLSSVTQHPGPQTATGAHHHV